MRITIGVDDLSPAQMQWLATHMPPERRFAPGEVRMCVSLAGPDATVHRELEVMEWVRLIKELNLIALVLETAEPRPPASVMWRQPRNAYERMQDLYGGYVADL